MGFKLGNLPIDEPVFLAPMSGVTDLPFRRLVRKFGAGLVFSEMIASRPMVEEYRRNPSAVDLNHADEFPVAVQLAGCEPDLMAEAAKIHAGRGAAIIDINFGCPVKKVVKNYAGSALMRDEPLALRIMEETVRAVDVPVTVKMRLGWDRESINAPALARMAQDAGVRMITVHGRTREQLYNGAADWDAVAAVKGAVSIPVIVNGDIESPQAARQALQKSGADGVMVGRGVYGRPWLVRDIMDAFAGRPVFAPPSGESLLKIILDHYDSMLDYYPVPKAVGIARKHIGWYCDGLDGADTLCAAINGMDDPKTVKAALGAFFSSSDDAVMPTAARAG